MNLVMLTLSFSAAWGLCKYLHHGYSDPVRAQQVYSFLYLGNGVYLLICSSAHLLICSSARLFNFTSAHLLLCLNVHLIICSLLINVHLLIQYFQMFPAHRQTCTNYMYISHLNICSNVNVLICQMFKFHLYNC
jgi:hypothetical protein